MTMTIGELAAAFVIVTKEVEHERHAIMEKVAKTLQEEAKRVIGTYDEVPPWPQLAESTQEERSRLGYQPNEPLLRTGALRDSIKFDVDPDGKEASVGTDDEKAVWQEFGTVSIPPRPFLGNAIEVKRDEIEKIAGDGMIRAVMSKARS